MLRVLAVAGCLLAAVSSALGWALPYGDWSGNRVATGKGTFPRRQALSIATDVPLRWLVAFPPQGLAAIDGDGTLWLFEIVRATLTVSARYGTVASPDAPLAAVRIDHDRSGIAVVAPDGRLLVWSDGALRTHDVGSRLSRLTCVVPVMFPGRQSHDLLAVAQDGAVVLIGGLAAGPRVVARLDVRALLDGRITLADLDGDGNPEAVVLSDPVGRGSHGILGDDLEAASVTVVGLRSHALELRGRFMLAPPAVFETLVPVLAPLSITPRLTGVLLTRNTPGQHAALVALTWSDGRLAPLAEEGATAQNQRWIHVIGSAEVSGGGIPDVIAVAGPHERGVVSAYRRAGATFVRVVSASGYSSHAMGSRNLEQAVIADFDGDGRPEVVLPRLSRDALVGLQPEGTRFLERWSLELRSPVQSNLVAADVDGDGFLDLAVADRRALHLYLSSR
jgi:hypothetical protein